MSEIEQDEMQKIVEAIKGDDSEMLNTILKKYSTEQISESTPYSNYTLFMYACEEGSPQVVKTFINQGAYLFFVKYADNNEFKSAVSNKKYSYEVISLLLEMFKDDKKGAVAELKSDGDYCEEFDPSDPRGGVSPLSMLKKNKDKKTLALVRKFIRETNK